MDGLISKLQVFIDDLRDNAIPVSTSQVEECYRSLSLIDWSQEIIFHAALFCTLLKESSLIPVFNRVYAKHFRFSPDLKNSQEINREREEMLTVLTSKTHGKGGSGMESTADDGQETSNRQPQETGTRPRKNKKDPMIQEFYAISLEDFKRMEELVPLLGKRLISKMVMKKRKNQNGCLDYRRTLRQSMSTGGIPVDIIIKKRVREKPVIFALCDVSVSCLEFSFFSLAMVNALESFFRQVRSFAFISETDEITSLLRTRNYSNLRGRVLEEADVVGATGYTDYGKSLISFTEKYGKYLSHKSYVIIFGDARTNWFPSEHRVLKEIQNRVKRVYWFNPEPKSDWVRGDSSMMTYAKYCDRVFECSNLEQLSRAISEL